MKIRTGLGYDIHKLEEGRTLFVGGVKIPFPKGLIGHSDGDCLIHAMIDALLGAMGERDIGQLFPDRDPEYRDIRSTELLKTIVLRLRKNKIEIVNIDSIIIAEEPELAPYISQMKDVLCSILGIEKDNLSIKAKTHEGLGEIGRREAMASWVLVLVKKI